MLKKIDCVMIRVEDVKAAMTYYADVFGLQPIWWDERSAGLVFQETDAEIVVHSIPDTPSRIEVHYLVENAVSAVQILVKKGCRILVNPFDIAIGKCAVIEDPFGTRLCILAMTKALASWDLNSRKSLTALLAKCNHRLIAHFEHQR